MTEHYRTIAMQWVTEPHRADVEAIARHLHANESLHLHECTEGREPCSYCWLRAAKAMQAIERAGRTVAQVDATNWHDTYQQHAASVDAFFAELLEMLPGATDTGSDAYDQIPRGIEALHAEVKRLQAEVATAVQRAGQAQAEADRRVADIQDAAEADGAQLQAENNHLRESERLVRALHAPNARGNCSNRCYDANHLPQRSPCATIRAFFAGEAGESE